MACKTRNTPDGVQPAARRAGSPVRTVAMKSFALHRPSPVSASGLRPHTRQWSHRGQPRWAIAMARQIHQMARHAHEPPRARRVELMDTPAARPPSLERLLYWLIDARDDSHGAAGFDSAGT